MASRFVDLSYNMWLKHAPQLYDFCTTHVLPTPSNFVRYISDSRRHPPNRDFTVQQVIVGTNNKTSPPPTASVNSDAAATSPISGLPTTEKNSFDVYNVFVPTVVDEEEQLEISKEDVDQFRGTPSQYVDVAPLMHHYQRVYMDSPVVRLDVNPQLPNVVAAMSHSQHAYVFELGKRRRFPDSEEMRPDLRLKGMRRNGSRLEWHPSRAGMLAVSSSDTCSYIFDIEATGSIDLLGTRPYVDIPAVLELKGHADGVQDITWHATHDHMLATSSMDGSVRLWDDRNQKAQHVEKTHKGSVHGVAFNPTGVYSLATCSSDKSIRVWDIRKMAVPITQLIGHTDSVLSIKWAPFNSGVLLSHGFDNTVICWDIGKMDDPRLAGYDDHAKPEVVFQHYGHSGCVREATWCPFEEDDWTIASVDDNNFLQMWSPESSIYNDQIDEQNYNLEVV